MMIKFEHTEVVGFEAAIRGMRNPMNSWEKSDSRYCNIYGCYEIGPNDRDLMKRLRNAGTDHRKFMRQIVVYVDITAPLYWWKEFDTYKVGTVANSCSTMHKIHSKAFTLEDFSCEHLISDLVGDNNDSIYYWDCKSVNAPMFAFPLDGIKIIVGLLNSNREAFLKTKDKKYWWQMIQLLPSSYNQKRTVMLNYEVLANIYKSRKNHKLDEWSGRDCFKDLARNCNTCVKKDTDECRGGKEGGFIQWIESLPYAELITGENLEDIPICNEILEEAGKRIEEIEKATEEE